MKLRVLVVDDEPLAISLIQSLVADIPDAEVVGTAADGEEAEALVRRLNPHVVLTDIRMPRQGGLMLARTLQDEADVDVIFITAFDHFALNAYDLEVVDYILKPVRAARLAAALEKVRRRRVGRGKPVDDDALRLEGFWIPHTKGSIWVPMLSIDWIEAARDYVLLHTATASHILRSTMDALERQLDGDAFLRISRSAIVRREAVATWQKQGSVHVLAVMGNGLVLKVGGKYMRGVEGLTLLSGSPRA